MNEITAEIRQKAKELLVQKKVAMILGYREANVPMLRPPYVAKTVAEVENLIWDEFCVLNLASFIPPDAAGKIGIITKGCDMQSLLLLHQEERINLDKDFYILGVSCQGMLDHERLKQDFSNRDFIESVAVVDGKQILIKGGGFEESKTSVDYIRDVCLACLNPVPEQADDMIKAQLVEIINKDIGSSEISQIKPSSKKKSDLLQDHFKDCIQCFACREVCPACYCETCFVDRQKANWYVQDPIGQSNKLDFHIFRGMHLLNRCSDCGACESVCPVHLPLRSIFKNMNQKKEQINPVESGLDSKGLSEQARFNPSLHENPKSGSKQ